VRNALAQGAITLSSRHPYNAPMRIVGLYHLPVEALEPDPHQPRRSLDPEALGALVASSLPGGRAVPHRGRGAAEEVKVRDLRPGEVVAAQ